MSGHLDDQRAAAATELGDQMAGVRAHSLGYDVQVTPEQAAQFAHMLDQATNCPHLDAVPIQPTYVLLGVRASVAECTGCFMSRREEIRECSWCGRDADLCPIVSESGHKVAVATVCDSCRSTVLALLGAPTT
jgi:hypothetical protein